MATYTILLDGESYDVQVASGAGADVVSTLGKVEVTGIKKSKPQSASDEQKDVAPSKDEAIDGEAVDAPDNGDVFKILCSVGEKVEANQTVIVLESMKMEIDVTAGVNGTVKSINVAKGENVEEGDTIFTVG